MYEDLADLDHDREFGRAIIDAHGLENLRVVDETGPPIHAQCVVKARNDEQQSDGGIGDDVRQAVQTVVAGAIRDRQRVLVKNPDKAGRVSARADIRLSIRTLRADAKEGRPRDEGPRVLVEPVLALHDGQGMGFGKQTSKRLLVRYDKFRIELEFRHHDAFRSSCRPIGLMRAAPEHC
jgi:hypothetical protein